MKHLKRFNENYNNSNDFLKNTSDDNLKQDRKNILNYIGHDDWNIVLRKIDKPSFWRYRFKFKEALRNIKVTKEFIDRYKDVGKYKELVNTILKNKKYTNEELIDIIETFPDYVDWYLIFYNKNIPLEFKKQNYDKIYEGFLKSIDINTPMDIRIKKTLDELSILKL